MAKRDLIRIVRVAKDGGPVRVDLQFGVANVGVYRVFLWDGDRRAQQIAFGDNVDSAPDTCELPVAPADLDGCHLSYEAHVESPKEGAGQSYSVSVLLRQDGRLLRHGRIERRGRLPASGSKSTIGFVRFETV